MEIHADYRSQGFGTKLIMAAEELLTKRQFERVALAVERSNVRAAELYERLGIECWPDGLIFCHSFDDSIEPPETCQVIMKELL